MTIHDKQLMIAAADQLRAENTAALIRAKQSGRVDEPTANRVFHWLVQSAARRFNRVRRAEREEQQSFNSIGKAWGH